MKVLKIIVIIIILIVALFFIIAAFLPGEFRVEQSVEIDTPVDCPFNSVNNLEHWQYWTPFTDDPEMVTTYSGPAAGVGAKSQWTSETQGDGSMTISSSIPFEKIVTDLDFGRRGTADSYFTFGETDGKTRVTWVMESEASYPIERYLFAILGGMMKTTFQTGLQQLKAHCESMIPETHELSLITVRQPAVKLELAEDRENPHLYVLNLNEKWIATIMDSCYFNEMEAKMGAGFTELMGYVTSMHGDEYGNPFSVWYRWDEENMFGVFEMGIAIKEQIPGKGRIQVRKFKPARAVVGVHQGPYDESRYMYEAIESYVNDHGLEESGGPIESYVLDMSQVSSPRELRTAIAFPIK